MAWYDALRSVYGRPYWSSRNDRLLTPSGPEGSSGSSRLMCRGVADTVDHLILICVTPVWLHSGAK
jgi:hypothetical protein